MKLEPISKTDNYNSCFGLDVKCNEEKSPECFDYLYFSKKTCFKELLKSNCEKSFDKAFLESWVKVYGGANA